MVQGPENDLVEVAAELLSLVSLARGAARSEIDERVARLERAAIAAAVRGHFDAWDLELCEALAFASPARALVWLCAVRAAEQLGAELRGARVTGAGVVVGVRRGRPFDVVRLLVTCAPRGDLELEAFAELLAEAQYEIDLAECAGRSVRVLEQLLAERRRAACLDALLPVLAALDAGTPLPDTADRLRCAAGLFDGRETPARRAAA